MFIQWFVNLWCKWVLQNVSVCITPWTFRLKRATGNSFRNQAVNNSLDILIHTYLLHDRGILYLTYKLAVSQTWFYNDAENVRIRYFIYIAVSDVMIWVFIYLSLRSNYFIERTVCILIICQLQKHCTKLSKVEFNTSLLWQSSKSFVSLALFNKVFTFILQLLMDLLVQNLFKLQS